MIYEFGDFELDERLYLLRRSGEPLKLEPKVLDVLVCLLRSRDRVVTKDELIEHVWPGQVISDAALTHCLAKARKAVDDDGGRQQIIKTQHGRGYRFIATVIERRDETPMLLQPAQGDTTGQASSPALVSFAPVSPAEQVSSERSAQVSPFPVRIQPAWFRKLFLVAVLFISGGLSAWLFFSYSFPSGGGGRTKQTAPSAFSAKPSLAVLPFMNFSGETQQDYFADGLTEDLITALSRISGLFVVARNSVYTYKGKPAKVEELGRELGAQYVLEGSVRKDGERVRISAQLVDTATGYHVWAERYDRPLTDIFALQDEITQNIVTALAVKLKEGESLAYRSTDNVEAYDYAARGWEYHFRFTQAANAQARQMFEKAVALDPKFTVAYIGLGRTYMLDWISVWNLSDETREHALELAQRAHTLDPTLPAVHTFLADVYLLEKQHDQAIDEAQQAIALDPSFAYGYMVLADILNFAGRPEEAISLLVEKAMRLDPGGAAYSSTLLGHSYLLLGRYDEAIPALKRTLTRNPDYLPTHVHLAAVYAELGRQAEAAAEMAECRRLCPLGSLELGQQRLPYKEPQDLQRILAALSKAGLR